MLDSTPVSPQSGKPADGWELACTGVLRTEFGRRQSHALMNAMIQLAAEEAWKEARQEAAPGWLERLRRWHAAIGWSPKLVFAAALVLVFAGAMWWRWPFGRGRGGNPVVCTVYEARDVHWAADSRQPKVGDTLTAGPLQLESGVVELEFPREEKIAIEGPAQLDLTNAYSMLLQRGKLAAYVPKSGVGFTLNTPFADVVDLGTQFGVSVTSETAKVGVFDGKVELTPVGPEISRLLTNNMAVVVDRAGTLRATTLSIEAFPQIARAVAVNPGNCDFDDLIPITAGGIPAEPGYWSGPACTLSGATEDVRPFDRQGMLRFLPARSNGADQAADAVRSEVWQVIDLRSYKELMAEGGIGKLSAMFNRVRDAQGANKFGLTLAAFAGRPEDAAMLWSQRNVAALALTDEEIATDDDPATWEKFEITAALPSNVDFVLVRLKVVGAAENTGTPPVVSGHFADLVVFKLRVPLRASSVSVP